ncbi:hypothetical protein BJX64DRAFT_264723 [Aspergillus heterothallicus]
MPRAAILANPRGANVTISILVCLVEMALPCATRILSRMDVQSVVLIWVVGRRCLTCFCWPSTGGLSIGWSPIPCPSRDSRKPWRSCRRVPV